MKQIKILLFLVNLPIFLLAQESNPFKPSDGIYINVFPDTNSFLNGVFAIDDRGYIELPLVGKKDVSKMSINAFSSYIKKTFKTYLRYPTVYVKPVVRISLLGGFTKPGLYYIDLNSSLWEAVLLAGGTTGAEGIYEMRWERNQNDETDDITSLFESGISLRSMGFKSGDQIWAPSPQDRTVWDTISDIMPLLTFSVAIFSLYSTYQRDSILLTR